MADKPETLHPEPPATAAETAEAERLRAALEDPALPSDDAETARALAAAWSPRELDAATQRALVERAVGRMRVDRRRRIARVSLGAGTMLALAASVALVVGAVRRESSPQGLRLKREHEMVIALSRSTQPLFSESFAAWGGQTLRVDRISMARASELRENEFARWGVR